MPKKQTLGEYLSRQSVYVLSDGERCLYVGQTTHGRAGVAGRMTNHLTNAAADENNRIGQLHAKMNASNKANDWYLQWKLEIYSVDECAKLTNKTLKSPREAERAMIEFLKPSCNAETRGRNN